MSRSPALQFSFKKVLDLFKAGEIVCICTELFHLFGKICRGNPQSVSLACGIDISQHKVIRVRERLGKFMEKCLGTGVGVRLEYTPYFIVRIVLCGL